MDIELINLENLIQASNVVKETVLSRLVNDKIITEENRKEYSEKWQIIIFKRCWFKKWLSIFQGDKDSDKYQYKYVKFEN